MKLVVNQCFGGFELSEAAKKRYIELSGTKPRNWDNLKRNDKHLVQVVEELGKEASTYLSDLHVVDILNGSLYRINYYDGLETIEFKSSDDGWELAWED